MFLEGPFKPVSQERSLTCDIEGIIPDVLSDKKFSRVGPNPMFTPEGGYHLFDGDGLIHWVEFADTDGDMEAMYHNRYIRTRKLKAEECAGKALFFNVGDFSKPFALLKIAYKELLRCFSFIPDIPKSHMSVANTNIIQHASKSLALCESGLPYSIDFKKSGLDTIGVESFGGFLKDSLTAHPKIDPIDGKMYGFGSDGSKKIGIYVFGQDGTPERAFKIDFKQPVLMHDFAITSRHMILLDMPLMFNMKLLFQGKIPVEFNPSCSSRLGVLDKEDTDGTSIRWYDIPGDSFMISHVVNSHYDELDDTITLISCDMETISLNDVCSSRSVLHKTTISIRDGHVNRERVLDNTDISMDFPVINKSMTGISNRYTYVTEFKHGIPGDILKVDLKIGAIVGSIKMGEDECSGECAFISDGTDEDEGYLLSFVTHSDDSKLYIWDAKTLDVVSTLSIPERIPLGFHANILD